VTSIPSSSVEYLHVPITGATSGMPVEIAIVARAAQPVDADWKTAMWDGSDAKVLIGPGTPLALTLAVYSVWVHIDAGTEQPVLRAGFVQIT
jgi:hypothetical protein